MIIFDYDYDYDNDHFCTQRHGDTELFFDYDYDDDYDEDWRGERVPS